MTKPRILVTSAAGRTGSAAVLQLLEKGFPITDTFQKPPWDEFWDAGKVISCGQMSSLTLDK